jgi:hypothetical protein
VEENTEYFNAVINHWSQILEKIKEYNHSLLSSLKLAIPAASEGNHIVVVFPYKFHKDAIEARKNRLIIDQVLAEVTGHKILIKPVLAKDWSKPLPEIVPQQQAEEIQEAPPSGTVERNDGPSDAELLESALKIMGGEVEK